jgi:hypothetical protein
MYETPMVLMAIIASNARTNTTSGLLGVLTYYVLAEEIVSYIAWAQNSNATYLQEYGYGYWLGGWRYYPQSLVSDNSVSGWPVLGLLAAQLWGISAPSWVKTELAQWTNTDQDMTGTPDTNPYYGSFGYAYRDSFYGGVPETAEGILELTYCGYPDTYANITAAEGYIYSMWTYYDGSWEVNIGSLYAMYGVMKAMRETLPSPTQFIYNYTGTVNVEWYNGTGEYADSLIANQGPANGYPNGAWTNWESWAENDEFNYNLATAFAVLILEFVPVRVTYNLNVTVLNAVSSVAIAGATVASVTGPESFSGITNGFGQVEFIGVEAGTYNISTSAAGYVTNYTVITLTSSYNMTVKLQPIPVSFVPEVPIGTITALMAMMMAMLGYLFMPRLRRKRQ